MGGSCSGRPASRGPGGKMVLKGPVCPGSLAYVWSVSMAPVSKVMWVGGEGVSLFFDLISFYGSGGPHSRVV